MCKTIDSFDGEYRFLSNYAFSPIFLDGLVWNTAEHFYQSEKCVSEKDREIIRLLKTPHEAKEMGQLVEIKPNWDKIKTSRMYVILLMKFIQNKQLKKKLLDTGYAELVEGNTWHDNFWGNCICPKCSKKEGKNVLGKLLMEVRKEILQ